MDESNLAPLPVNDTFANQAPGHNHATAHDGGAIVQLRLGLETSTIAIVVSLVLIIGACGVVMGLNLAKQAQDDRDFRDLTTQYKLNERRLMDLEGYLIVNGLKKPGDDAWGPTGNLQRMKPKEK